jgi:hypothetical protein
VTRTVADPEFGPARCRDCNAVVVWALTDTGRRMPVDFEPSPQGTLELFTEHFPDGSPVDPGVQRVRRQPPNRPPGSPAWSIHWATCPARRPLPPRLPADIVLQVERAAVRKFGPLYGLSRFWGRA